MVVPPAKIVIAGGTGLVGTALWKALKDRGHEVVLLVRSTRPDLPPGVSQRPWTELDAALEGAAAVINLAGEGIADHRWTPAQRLRILESRTLSTRRIVEALGRSGESCALVNASAIGYYGYRSPSPMDEGSPAGEGFLAEVCRAWEAEADAARGIRVVRVRLGMVLAREGGALPRLARTVRWGLGAKLGTGSQGMSWIHIEDLVGLLADAALDPDFKGAYNAVSPNPVSNAIFTETLGQVLHRPILPVPSWVTAAALRLVLGSMGEEMLLGGAFVRPTRLLAQGFGFRYPDLEQALESLLQGKSCHSPGVSSW